MRQKGLLKTMFLLCALIVGNVSAWADEESVTFSEQGYSNQQVVASYEGSNFSIAFNKGGVQYEPTYYTNGNAIRIYGGGYMTVTSAYTITKIVLTFGTGDKSNTISTDGGTYDNGTWTGSASSVKFTVDGNSGHRRIAGVTVTTEGGSGPIALEGIALNKTETTIYEGKTETLTLTFTPTNATNKNVTWTSSNEDVATVSEEGVVTGVAIGNATITATSEDGNHQATCNVTVAELIDYATIPFNWEGGTKAELTKIAGVTAEGLGTDYAESNAPYRVKFDGDGDYIQIKTNSQPGIVSMMVKMLGGENTSYITVQESADGETFTEVDVLTISGAKDDILYLTTSKFCAEDSRYVKLIFTKGSNVGVGPISISEPSITATITDAGWATWIAPCNVKVPAGVSAYIVSSVNETATLGKLLAIPAGEPVILQGAANTYNFTPCSDSDLEANEVDVTANLLLVGDGVTETTNPYVLAKKNNTVGFYQWGGSVANLKGKVYIESAADAREFIGFSATTGIETVNVERGTVNGAFNLAGQRVAQPTKGLYIVNGKKVVIK